MTTATAAPPFRVVDPGDAGRITPPSAADTAPAEAGLLGVLLLPHTRGEALLAAAELDGADLSRPGHGLILDAIRALDAEGVDADALLVAERIRATVGDDTGITVADLLTLAADAPSTGAVPGYVRLIVAGAQRRNIARVGGELRERAGDPTVDTAGLAVWAATELEHTARPAAPLAPRPLSEFLDVDDVEHDWVIPGLLERQDRAVVTGPEGGGKSTLLRQVALMCGAGLHPFTGEPMTPLRVLLVDVENPERLVRRALRDLRARPCTADADAMLAVHLAADVDLLDARSAAALEASVDLAAPELLVIGPLYKLAGGDPTEEVTARAVAAAIDRIRARHHCAVIIEAHTPHGDEERPYGASLWKRWPEFGIYLSATGALRHWRGQRDQRDWPAALVKGGSWPWTPAPTSPQEPAWDGPRHCRAAIVRLLEAYPGDPVTVNQLTDRLRAGGASLHKRTISVAAESLAADGVITVHSGPRGSRVFMMEEASDALDL